MFLEDYEIDLQHEIGRGTFGTVFHANRKPKINDSTNEQQSGTTKYCAKMFTSNKSSPEELAILKHLSTFSNLRNIVQVFATGITGPQNRLVIIMERLEGGEVFDGIIKYGRFSERKAAKVILNLMTGLYDLHRITHVLHRDVKPENLVFCNDSEDSEVKLIDFGHAIQLSSEEIDTGVVINTKVPFGTQGYIAPETIQFRRYSSKTDVWSCGVTLYSLLSGFFPFDQSDLEKQTRQIIAGRYIPLTSSYWKAISDDAKDLVSKMLTVRPSARITVEEVLAHPWLQNNTSVHVDDENFGVQYIHRIRKLASLRRMKRAVNTIIWTIRVRKSALHTTIMNDIDVLEGSGIYEGNEEVVVDGTQPNVIDENSFATAAPIATTTPMSPRPASGIRSKASLDPRGTLRVNSTVLSPESAGPSLNEGMDTKLLDLTREQIVNLRRKFIEISRARQGQASTAYGYNSPRSPPGSQNDLPALVPIATPRPNRSQTSFLSMAHDQGVTYEVFAEVMVAAGLQNLANRSIFQLFDSDGNGVVDYREFLVTLVSSCNAADYSVRLYFDIFDLDGSGEITLNEMQVVLASILLDRSNHMMMASEVSKVVDGALDHALHESAPTPVAAVPWSPTNASTNHGSEKNLVIKTRSGGGVFTFPAHGASYSTLDALFQALDLNHDGMISFEEFKAWVDHDGQFLHSLFVDAFKQSRIVQLS